MTSRRSFLSKLVLAAAPVWAEVPRAESSTLVHIFLRGGADTLNFWVPYADDRYYQLRPGLAISEKKALRLNERYAMHPALKPLQPAFLEGRLGVVQSVGLDNTSGSHFDCQDQMEHGDSMTGTHAGGGWLGRFLRGAEEQAGLGLTAVAIGSVLPESLRGAPSVSVLERLSDLSLKAGKETDQLTAALQKMYGAEVTLLGHQGQETLKLFSRVQNLQNAASKPSADYPNDGFGRGLHEVSRLIQAQVGLKVACLDLGGWDTHFFQGSDAGTQAERMSVLASGLAAFQADLRGYEHRYTIMVTTEFGRRVYENASLGTDHGRGFAFMALGEAVQGGHILGPWPIRSEEDVNLNTPGPGGLHAETDFRQVFAEVLLSTFGKAARIKEVFPDLKLTPVGLMKNTA